MSSYSQYSSGMDQNQQQGQSSSSAPSPSPSRPRVGASSKRGKKSLTASTTASPHISNSELAATGTGNNASGSSIQWANPVASEIVQDSNTSESSHRRARGETPIDEKLRDLVQMPASASGSDTNMFVMDGLANVPAGAPGHHGVADDEGEGEDDHLPDMADDDYSAQLSWQSQSKDNLKVLMDNFTPEQYDRYEAYRRNALPKQAIRKVVQQALGCSVSTPVAQVVAGFAKVFVGEMVEKARKVQERRGEAGPLSPDHLREAYLEYQAETGRVGSARPLRNKKLFVR